MAIKGGSTAVDANRLDIQDVARFAVDEHNRKENKALEFKKVVNAKTQVVAGTMFYITLEAKDGDKMKVYKTEIWEKSWENFKEVQKFDLVGDAPAASSS